MGTGLGVLTLNINNFTEYHSVTMMDQDKKKTTS